MVLNNPVYFKAGPVKQPPDNLSREQLSCYQGDNDMLRKEAKTLSPN